jgi:colanic acid/amylovoran biosynthesis glycosyltransferase
MKPIIGHIVARYLPRSEIFTYRLINSLTAFDHHIFTTRSENLDIFPTQNLTVAKSEAEYPGLAARAGANLVFSHFGPSGLAGMQVGLMNDIPSVTIFHGYDVSMLLHSPRWVEQYQTLFHFSSHCICISEVGRQRLIEIGCPPDKVSAVHLGVDLAWFVFKDRGPMLAQTKQKRLLMVSRLAEKKGIPYALRAFRVALAIDPSLTMRVVGEGEDRPQLESLRKELGMESQIEFVGALDGAGVCREISDCHVLLQPSITAHDGDQEGIPVALMEAQAGGIPVIATRHSGIPELVLDGRTGILVPERDVDALAQAILRIVGNPALASSLGYAGRNWVEREFNLKIQADRFTRLLVQIYEGHPQERYATPNQIGLKSEPRILFLRSVTIRAALVKLLILRRRYPAAHITVLTTGSTRDSFDKCPIVDQVLCCPGERFNWGKFPIALRAELQRGTFDRVIVPYTNEDGAGYENVREVALACGARHTVAMPWSQSEVPLRGYEERSDPAAANEKGLRLE